MTGSSQFLLTPGGMSLGEAHALRGGGVTLSLTPDSWPGVERSADCVRDILDSGQVVYGINTGFGILARETIARDKVCELQRRLVLSHAAGVGRPLSPEVVRLTLALKIGSLARGFSGVRPDVLNKLLALYNADMLPVIPEKGSVGASGDLAPLAHLAAVLLGEGKLQQDSKIFSAAEGLAKLGLAPMDLEAKEGLALLNGTQVSTALALEGLFQLTDLFAAALCAGALSVDAALGSDTPFDPRIHALRGHPGQSAAAQLLKKLLDGSQIRHSHVDCSRVQDPYSLRCQPQVMGAVLDTLEHAAKVLIREANAVSDNPLVFADDGDILSGGNFHAEPVAFAADAMAVAGSEIGALSERRIALLTDSNLSDLPAFLVAEPGLNSGFMLAHVTAAALASENKALAVPTSTDSLPTSANQEDHVSMATHGARRLADIAFNCRNIVAIELLAAAQGVEFRKPLQTSAPLAELLASIRDLVPFRRADTYFAPDIEAVEAFVSSGKPRRLLIELGADGLLDLFGTKSL